MKSWMEQQQAHWEFSFSLCVSSTDSTSSVSQKAADKVWLVPIMRRPAKNSGRGCSLTFVHHCLVCQGTGNNMQGADQTSGAVWHADKGNRTIDLPITRGWLYPWATPVILLHSLFLHHRSLSGISVAYVKQSYNDNQLIVSVSFQAKVSNISWFQLLKCEDLFLFSDSKSRVWGFWTKDISLWCGDTKNCHGKNAIFLHNLSRLYGLNY